MHGISADYGKPDRTVQGLNITASCKESGVIFRTAANWLPQNRLECPNLAEEFHADAAELRGFSRI
jgi:hypothetical protein